MARFQERRQQASLTFFYKIHNNLVTIDKNRHLSEAGGNRVPDPTPFSITDRLDGLEIFFLPQDNCNLEWTYNRSCLCEGS